MYICVYMCLSLCIYRNVSMYMYVFMCIHVFAYTYIYIYIYETRMFTCRAAARNNSLLDVQAFDNDGSSTYSPINASLVKSFLFEQPYPYSPQTRSSCELWSVLVVCPNSKDMDRI